jgi:phosphohistidine phosphatase
MKLYFLRHGHAESATSQISDHDRTLTDEGVRHVTNAARVMAAMQVLPDHVFSSPRLRARQTAEIVAGRLSLPVQTRDEVNFGFDLHGLQHILEPVGEGSSVMFVGHEPSLSQLIRQISGARIALKKCGLARIDVDNITAHRPRGQLVWLLTPRVFDAVCGE